MLFVQTTTCFGETYRQKWTRKGRLKIPAAFLEKLKEHGDRFYVTSEEGDHARIYPMKIWGRDRRKAGENLLLQPGQARNS